MGKRSSSSGGINLAIKLMDGVSSTLKNIDQQNRITQQELNRTAQAVDRLSQSMYRFQTNMGKDTLQRRYNNERRLRLQAQNNLERDNRQYEYEQLRHQNKLEEIEDKRELYGRRNAGDSGVSAFNLHNLASALYIFKSIYDFTAKIVTALAESIDDVISQKARLGLYNTSGYSTGQMYQYLAKTALGSRSDMSATAELTNRLLAAGVYSGEGATVKTIDTVGLINKALVASGGNTKEVQSVLLQLSQGLAQGQLQGQELKAIRQYAPYLGNIIIEGLNKQGLGQYSLGDLKELGAGGELTTERVLKSIELMANKINEDFEKMPKTWGQAMTNLNTLWSSFLNLLDESNSGIQILYDTMWNFTDYLSSSDASEFWENLALAANTFFTLASMGLDLVAQGLMWLVNNIDAVIGVASILFTIMAIGWVATHWQILAVLGALYVLVQVFDAFGISGIQILATIIGVLAVVISTVQRLATAISWSLVAAFQTLGSIALGILGSIAQAIGKILDALGIDWGGTLLDWGRGLDSKSEVLNKQSKENWAKAGEALFGGKSVTETFTDAYDQIMGIQDGVDSFKETMKNLGSPGGAGILDNLSSNGAVNTNVKGGKLDSAGKVDLSDEDIQLLRDIAAREYLINISTSAPVMTNNFGDIRETADINRIMEELARMADEELATSVVAG